jgi:monoamine oxidase
VETRDRQQFTTDKLIVSLPVSILKQMGDDDQELSFNPIPKGQFEFINEIGYGTVVKLVTIWKSVFWKNNFPSAQFIFSPGFIPTWWTQYPLDVPILTGWLGGPGAENFSEQPDDFFLSRALETLSLVFSIDITELKNELVDFRVFNWKNEIWSRGAYSYPTVQFRKAKPSAMKSWGRKIYFAGEAFYEGAHPGTVEAALVSGADTARLLLHEM